MNTDKAQVSSCFYVVYRIIHENYRNVLGSKLLLEAAKEVRTGLNSPSFKISGQLDFMFQNMKN